MSQNCNNLHLPWTAVSVVSYRPVVLLSCYLNSLKAMNALMLMKHSDQGQVFSGNLLHLSLSLSLSLSLFRGGEHTAIDLVISALLIKRTNATRDLDSRVFVWRLPPREWRD